MATNLRAGIEILFRPRTFHIDRNYTIKDIFEVVQQHDMLKPAYQMLEDYYKGKHVILQRTFDDTHKPNNKIIHNFPKLIVDNSVSYFVGKPINYISEDEKLKDEIEDISTLNDEDDENAELAKLSSIYGHAFEVVYYTAEGEIKYKAVKPADVLYLRSMDIEDEPLCAVHYRAVDNGGGGQYKYFLTIYDKTHIREYVGEGKSPMQDMTLVRETRHYFGEVPVVEYIANTERMGDFETIISLVDAYNLAVSDSVNDINYFNDAYLLLKNLIGTEPEEIEEMKNNRVMLTDEEGDAKWLVKQVNDKHIENIKERLVADIHKFSMTPNLQDEKFASNLSGVAISYKLIGLENKTAVRERKFATGIKYRNKLIVNLLNVKGADFNPLDIKPVFTRNIPQNLNELVNTVVSLQDIVPNIELLSQLPFLEDPEKAQQDLEEQRKKDQEIDYQMVDYDVDMGGLEDDPEPNKGYKESPRADLRTARGSDTVRKPKGVTNKPTK